MSQRILKNYLFYYNGSFVTEQFGYDANHARRIIRYNIDSVPGIVCGNHLPCDFRRKVYFSDAKEMVMPDAEGVERRTRECVDKLNAEKIERAKHCRNEAALLRVFGFVQCCLDL